MKIATGILGLTAIVVLASNWTEDSGHETEPEAAPLSVRTILPEPVSSISRQRTFAGTIVAARRSRLAFERSARLLEVMVDDGDDVQIGQILARIDTRQLQTEVDELSAQLQQQHAVLAELQAGPRAETIAATKAERDALTADVELRKATLDRINGLYQRGATSIQSLDESRLAWKSSVATREAVDRKYDELVAGTRQEQVAAQKAIVAALDARLKRLQIDLQDSELAAPYAGTIVNRSADEGDMLSAQQPVFELLENGQLEARIGVPPSVVSKLDREGYVVLSANNVDMTGKVRRVVAEVDANTRTQTVIVEIAEVNSQSLADGQLVRLKFDETQPVNGFRVPLSALASGSRESWTVYVVESTEDSGDDFIVVPCAIEVIQTDGEWAVIRGDISTGERIVAAGIHRIVPGQRVSDSIVVAEKE